MKSRKAEGQSLMTTDLLKEGERLDDLERNGLSVIQNHGLFCFGMDAVLLSGYAKAYKGDRVMDLCTGNGIIPILMSAKTEGDFFYGMEIQSLSADMARRSVRLNSLEEKIDIIEGDIKEAGIYFDAASFDVVTSNPPYMIQGHGIAEKSDSKAIAKHEILCSLEDVVSAASYLLKNGGRLYMVHRPFRLADIFEAMRRHGIEPKRMKLVYPDAGKDPTMVLIEARKGGKPYLNVEKPLIIYGPDGKYTEEITEIYGY